MTRVWTATVFALAVGCTPPLNAEFSCAVRGICPSTQDCWADGVCREGEPDFELNEQCDSDEGCDTRFCAESIDTTSTVQVCSVECEGDADCAGVGSDGALCLDEVCRPRCLNPMDCPSGLQCWYALVPGEPPPMSAVCFDMRNRMLNGSGACNGMGREQCAIPGWCMRPTGETDGDGVCSMLCERGEGRMQCPIGTECAPIYSDIGHCLIPCPEGDECEGTELECVSLAVDGEASPYCAPVAWMPLSFPLPGRFAASLPPPPDDMGMMGMEPPDDMGDPPMGMGGPGGGGMPPMR